MKNIEFWMDFVGGNSKQIAKLNGFGRKNQLSPQYVHIAKFRNFQSWKCEKLKNVFTLWANSWGYTNKIVMGFFWSSFEDCILQLDLKDCQKKWLNLKIPYLNTIYSNKFFFFLFLNSWKQVFFSFWKFQHFYKYFN